MHRLADSQNTPVPHEFTPSKPNTAGTTMPNSYYCQSQLSRAVLSTAPVHKVTAKLFCKCGCNPTQFDFSISSGAKSKLRSKTVVKCDWQLLECTPRSLSLNMQQAYYVRFSHFKTYSLLIRKQGFQAMINPGFQI